jgi:hypothetical protein
MMPEVTVDLDVYCGTCGTPLCHQTNSAKIRGRCSIYVAVCGECVDAAKDRGYTEGYNKGCLDSQEA